MLDDSVLARAFEKFQSPTTFNPLARSNLAGLLIKPARTRSFNQRDIARALRAAKAAGVEARVVIEEGRITLMPTKMVPAATDTDENPWERFRRG
jgi:hypothetical protein